KGEGRARSEFFLPESIHIIDRLRKVIDPELGADIISLALLETLAIDSPGVVRVVLGATTPFCPYLQQIAQITLDTILNTPGIVRATVKLDPNLNHPRRW
ncbi:MAG: iron-sulfur cluster assembly protein, partial [candidate division WOR-3 bacterium]